jgi:nitrogen regulatory protein PII
MTKKKKEDVFVIISTNDFEDVKDSLKAINFSIDEMHMMPVNKHGKSRLAIEIRKAALKYLKKQERSK